MTFEVSEEGNACAGVFCDLGNERGSRNVEAAPPEAVVFQDEPNNDNVAGDGLAGEELLSERLPLAQLAQQQQQVPSSREAIPSKHPSVSHYYCGLRNLGNTCYVNSILQALFSLSKVRRHIYRMEESSSHVASGTFHRTLGRLFFQMRRGTYSVLEPADFCIKFRLAKPQFVKHEQHDAQEFLCLLLELLHDECNEAKDRKIEVEIVMMKKDDKNEVKEKHLSEAPKTADEAWAEHVATVDDSTFSKLLMGQTESCLTCQTCGHRSVSWSSFWQIPLAVPQKKVEEKGKENKKEKKNGKDDSETSTTTPSKTSKTSSLKKKMVQQQLTLVDCLSEFTEMEILTDDSAPNCDKCGRREDASKKLSIVRSPHYLTLHLKRFDEKGHKITRPVTIPNELALADRQYHLRCCVLHRGSEVHQGHYKTLIAEREKNSTEATPSSWVLADDDLIDRDWAHERAQSYMQRYAYIVVYQAVSGGEKVSKLNGKNELQQQAEEKEETTSAHL